MEWLYDWVWNLVIYFILLTALMGVLPKDNYKKYIRLFTGVVMILIMIDPILKLGNLDQTLESYLRKNTFEQERQELTESMEGMQDVGQEFVLERYKSRLKEQIQELAAEEGLEPGKMELLLEEDADSENYGRILYLKIEVDGADGTFIKMLESEFGIPAENINLGDDYE